MPSVSLYYTVILYLENHYTTVCHPSPLVCIHIQLYRCFNVVDHGGELQASVGYQHLSPTQAGQDTVLILINQMRRETEAASNTQYVTTDPQFVPTG